MVHGEPLVEGDGQSDDFLTVYFHPASQGAGSDKTVGCDCLNQILLTSHKPSRMGTVDIFATEADQVSRCGGVLKVVDRENLRSGVSDDIHIMCVCNSDRIFKRDNGGVRIGTNKVDHRCGLRTDCGLQLLRGAPAFVAGYHELASRYGVSPVKSVSLLCLDDDFVFHARGVWKLIHFLLVIAGHTRGSG